MRSTTRRTGCGLAGADDTAGHPLTGIAGGKGHVVRTCSATRHLLVAVRRDVGEVVRVCVDDDRGAVAASRSSSVNAFVVVTSMAEPSSRTCRDARSPLSG